MRIAIVTPLPIPFALGGAENLWSGLQSHIEDNTPHSCDIVSISAPEGALIELVTAYETFSRYDLSSYDMVISGKYPAWMIDHPNHVCYMLHRLRGLYDTYRGPVAVDSAALPAPLRGLVSWMGATRAAGAAHHANAATIAEFFDRFRHASASANEGAALAFPGPLARAIVHFLDDAALSPNRIRHYAAISATVARRAGYFPAGVPVSVLYPPPHRDDCRCGSHDYFFTSSRLDGPKRIAMLVEAMAHVKADIPLLIAGTGPDEQKLKSMAAGDPRIKFLGFVPDDRMQELYADALAVPFIPADEDYGLVTIEAMRSGKPVLTTTDSGGPCEFVRDGQTGFVVPPDAKALGGALDRLAANPSKARAMGEAARELVAPISWSAVFDGLLNAPARIATAPSKRRPKLTVATTFPIWPPMGGGQARVFHLYRHLAERFDVDIVTLSDQGDERTEIEIAPGVVEIRIPKTDRHLLYERQLSDRLGHTPVGDIAANALTGLTPDFRKALTLSSAGSAAIVASHPFLIDDVKAAPGKPIWYEAHNVELDLKQTLLASFPEAQPLLDMVYKVESTSWREARHVFGCAARDLERLGALYGGTRAFLHEVPNGVALAEIDFTPPAKRRALRLATGLADTPIALFVGSWHGPNLEAIEQILQAAAQLPGVRFMIAGSACRPFEGRSLPANVDMLGEVEASTRNDMLAACDVALNPMRSGSGTNLKMLDYFAAGIPVVSSRFGARGLAVEEGVHYAVADEGRLADALTTFFARSPHEVDATVIGARKLVEERYSWDVIAKTFLAELEASDSTLFAGKPSPITP